jgi:6-pyruvoyltetrahydropterin/6-carboxytetrahydropterin synthase
VYFKDFSYFVTRETSFSAAHLLRGYNGECSHLHGHNWKVQVTVKASNLDELGMVIDFKVLDKEIKAVAEELDHHFINEVAPFDNINPTSENLAAFIFKELSARIDNERLAVFEVKVWETEKSCATVRR